MKPEWKIYISTDAQFSIGQAITWHKALDMLVKKEGLVNFEVRKNAHIVFVKCQITNSNYKIVKER